MRKEFQDDYNLLCSKIDAMKEFEFTEYRDAIMMVLSRSFRARMGGEPARVFVPYADMLDHDEEKSQVFGSFSDINQNVTFVSTKPMAKGDTMYLKYEANC